MRGGRVQLRRVAGERVRRVRKGKKLQRSGGAGICTATSGY
jgi:hypothetical protein